MNRSTGLSAIACSTCCLSAGSAAMGSGYRSVRTRQPDRLERIARLLVDLEPREFLVAEGPDPGDVVVELEAARATPGPRVDEDDDLATGSLQEPLRFKGHVLERLG